MSSDDMFDRLVRKQADRELEATREELTDSLKTRLTQLFSVVRDKGAKATDEDLKGWQAAGTEVPISLVIFGAFLQGIPLPEVNDPEIHTKALGNLGACLNAGPKLFGFYDEITGVTHLPMGDQNWSNRISECPRFAMFYSTLMAQASRWAGCTPAASETGEKSLVFDGLWAGGEPKTIIEYFMRMVFENRTIVIGTKRLEQIEFEIEMRKAFGK